MDPSASPRPLHAPAVPRVLQLVCFALAVANVAYIAASWYFGQWLTDPNGFGVPADFTNVWAAGRLVNDGQPALAYDWTVQKQVENAVIGYDFDGHYGWHYPPPFLFVAAVLATLPYAWSFFLWCALTLLPYLAAVRGMVGHRIGWLVAAACPAALSNAMIGQNGFLTTALLAGAVGLMERRPALAGICLGCLTYKPHFGLLFPVVLIASGHWRVFGFAAATGIFLALASWLAYGTDSWLAFFHWLPLASQAFLTDGLAGWNKLQSIYGLTRILGGGNNLAWTLQLAAYAGVAAVLCVIWRSRAAFEMKAAALATGTLLVTPYVYIYDQVILVIPAALLIRLGLRNGFHRHELSGLGLAAALLVAFPLMTNSTGLLATLIVGALITRRILRDLHSSEGIGAGQSGNVLLAQ